MKNNNEPLLKGVRVLDLTDDKGYLCGRMLADLGADVIKVERPGGDPGRSIGPFYHDEPDPEKSLFWFAYNLNKRGITLDIESADGRQMFCGLASKADIIVESFLPGFLESIGLGYGVLSRLNAGLIMTSITSFGQTGPYCDYKAPDLVGMAMGGIVFVTGSPDRPPVRVSFPQAYLQAASQASVGTMLAYYHRESTGEGQQVDVSMQQSVVNTLTNVIPWWVQSGVILQRTGSMRGGIGAKVNLRIVWPCKDGYVSFLLIGGKTSISVNYALVNWMDSEGAADEHLKNMKWEAFDMAKVTPAECKKLEDALGAFFSTHTKVELYEGALQRGVQIMPVSEFKDVVADRQLRARNYWVEVPHPELGDVITYPGASVQIKESPIRYERRAPLIGEHNQDVYGKALGFTREDLVRLKQARVI